MTKNKIHFGQKKKSRDFLNWTVLITTGNFYENSEAAKYQALWYFVIWNPEVEKYRNVIVVIVLITMFS